MPPVAMNDRYSAASGRSIYAGRIAQIAAVGNVRVAIWGQSNALGRADRTDIAAAPLASDAELAAYDNGTFDRVYVWNPATSTFQKLQPSLNNGSDAGQFGLEFGLAVRWMRETQAGNLYLEKAAASGAPITYFNQDENWYYGSYRNAHNAGSAWLSGQGIAVSAKHWVWVQGEGDFAQSTPWYQAQLEKLMADRVTDGMTTGKSLLFQMVPTSSSYSAAIAAAKVAVAQANPSNVLIMDGVNFMKADNLHQNGRGQVQMGYDSFEKLFAAHHIST